MNKIKITTIIILLIAILGLIGYGISYAIKNYNADQIVSLDLEPYRDIIENSKVDKIEQPNKNREITTDTLPKVKDTITELSYKNFTKLFNTSKKSLLILVKDGCEYCKNFEPIYLEALQSLKVNSYKINVSKLKEEEIFQIYDYINFTGTPITYVIQNGNVLHTLSGQNSLERTKAFIEDFYLKNN